MPEASSSRPFSLYIVLCADDTLYTGIAIDVGRRFAQHASGVRGAKYLRGKGPLQLVFSAEVGDRSRASRLEYRVKRLSRDDKQALVDGRSSLEEMLRSQVLDDDRS